MTNDDGNLTRSSHLRTPHFVTVGDGTTIPITSSGFTSFRTPSGHVFRLNHFGVTIRSLQTDNGTEFLNKTVDTLLTTHGTALQLSCPYTSQQNGKAERAICTINDTMRTLIFVIRARLCAARTRRPLRPPVPPTRPCAGPAGARPPDPPPRRAEQPAPRPGRPGPVSVTPAHRPVQPDHGPAQPVPSPVQPDPATAANAAPAASSSGASNPRRTRSGHQVRPVDRLNLSVVDSVPDVVSTTFRQEKQDPQWRAAMSDEYQALVNNNTWSLVPRPPRANVVTGKWIFRQKFHSDGTLARNKARWIVRGSWPIRKLDVKNAFLHGSLDEVVYCQQPTGFVDASRPDHVCCLHKSLYGLKQAPRTWYHRFASYITTLEFVASATDTSLFVLHSTADTAYLLLYVDDIIVTASSTSFLEGLLVRLHSEFAMTHLGDLHYFLGLPSHACSAHVSLGSRETCSAFGVTGVWPPAPCLLVDRPTYSDADWAGCPDSPAPPPTASTGDSLISWSSKRQTTVSLSYAEAEYRAVAHAVAECCWLRQLLQELHRPLSSATVVYCDNVSGIYMSSNPVQHKRTKHIEIDIHFVREKVSLGEVCVLHVPSSHQFADVMTKGLPSQLFLNFRSSLNVREPPAGTAGVLDCTYCIYSRIVL
ncbi:hypothetical protein QYE76_000853 [Lolium multiflorum]|uniref:Integrase catalytic domain-containing protein n=1 Tax=Lolium multiflorum TaxID=4521 RepID=A0AAD8VYS1_LOLMU|nr:hypothetical protein QYE76_000853 [Lolium multiflorum]